MGTRAWGVPALVAISLLYFAGLDRAPVVVGGDEAQFAVHAHSIATTGRDLNGTRLPLFVRITDPLVPNNSSQIWYQPFLFYAIAIVLKLLPVSDTAIRLPTAAIAVLNVWLVYAIGRRLFPKKRDYAVLAALLLALTPAQFIVGRQALDYICPVPFVLVWLWCLLTYLEDHRDRFLAAGGLALGAGVFSYIAAWILMPMFFAVTLLVLWRGGLARRSSMLALSAGFAAPVAVLIAWLAFHPGMLSQTTGRYALGGFELAKRVTIYWDYFNPSFLFIAGGSNPTQATSRVGAFLLPVAALLIVALFEVRRRRPATPVLILLAGFLIAPLPIVVTMPRAPEYSIARAMLMLPFGVLIATFGLEVLMEHRRAWVRAAGVMLLLLVPLQFAFFTLDYFNDYQVRSAARLDPVNIRDVAGTVLARDQSAPVPAIYFDADLDDKGVRWRLELLKRGRMDLWDRTRDFDPAQFDPDTVAVGSLLVMEARDPRVGSLIEGGAYSVSATMTWLTGEPAVTVLRRDR